MKFADSSWWAAWSLPGDRHHTDSLTTLDRLGPSEQVLTSNLVIGETWTFLRRKGGHATALAFLTRTDALSQAARLVIHRVSADQEDKAWRWLRKHDERAYSYVDATSFQVMRDRRLREALAFDQDFAAAGFIELRP